MLRETDVDQKELVLIWVPGRVSNRGNEAVDTAAKDLDKKPTDDLMPFSHLKPLTAKCTYTSCLADRM